MKVKMIKNIFLCLLLILTSQFSLAETQNNIDNSKLQTLTIGFPSRYIEPLAMADEDGEIVGLLPSLFRRYAEQAGYKVEILPYATFSDVMNAYIKGELDVMIGVTATLERESIMTFTEPMFAVRRAAISATPVTTYKELENKTVATIKGFADESFLRNVLPSASSLSVPSNLEAIRTVALGLADAQIGDGVMLYEHYKNSPYLEDVDMYMLDDLPVDTLYVGVPKSDSEMLERLNQGIREVNALPEHERILNRWLDERQQEYIRKASSLTLSKEEQQWIDNHPVIGIGVESDWAPIEVVENGVYKGIAADVLEEVSRLTGIKFDPKYYSTHRESYWAFLDGEFEMMSSLSPTAKRREKMLLSQAFMREPWVLIGRSDDYEKELSFDNLEKSDVIGVIAATYGQSMAKEFCVSCTVLEYDSVYDLVTALNESKVDVAISSLLLASPYLQGQYAGQLKVINNINERSFIPVTFAVNKENQILLNIINKALSVIPPSKMVEIEKKWMSTSYQTGVQTQKVVLWISIISVVSLLIIGVVFYWNRKLQGEVQQRVEAETELKRRVQFERSLLNAIPFPIVVKDIDGNIVTTNPAISMLSASDDDLAQFVAGGSLESKELDEIVNHSSEDQRVLAGEMLPRMEKNVVIGGKERQFSYWKCPYQLSESSSADGVVTILNDVTELRNAELRAREAEQRVQYLADNVSGAVIQHVQSKEDLDDLNFTFVSAGIQELVGVSSEELVKDHRKFLNVLDEQQRDDFIAHTRVCADIGSMSYELHITSEDRDKWLHLQSRITSNSDHFTWNTVLTDITELKNQQAELEAAKAKAIAGTEAKSRFLANMSHEIRTPISGIIGLLEIFSQYPMRDDALKVHSSLTKSADNLLHIVNDILDFSKIEAGKLTLSPIDADIHSMLSRITQTQASHAHAKGLKFEYWLSPKVASIVHVDDVRLGQILNNFINNAIKFTEKGHIRLAVDLLAHEGSYQTLRFSVSDTGVGINEDAQNSLFMPFVQADESTQRKFGGTGLGLSITNELVAQMGGEITVVSQLGEGSCFSVVIPVKAIEQQESLNFKGEKSLVVGEFNQLDDLIEYMSHCDVKMDHEAFDDKNQLAFLASRNRISSLFITRFEYERLDLKHSWIKNQLPGVKCIVLERRKGMLSPEPYDGFWAMSVNPIIPDQLYHCLKTPVAVGASMNVAENQNKVVVQSRKEAIENGRLILVAEDHPINRQVIMTMLSQLGYTADVVNDGAQAFEALQSDEYGLLLTDCHMPEMDGYELTKAVRAKEGAESREAMPIIALTANAIQGEDEKCIELGMSAFLSKPVSKVKLTETLDHWLPQILSAQEEIVVTEDNVDVAGENDLIAQEHSAIDQKSADELALAAFENEFEVAEPVQGSGSDDLSAIDGFEFDFAGDDDSEETFWGEEHLKSSEVDKPEEALLDIPAIIDIFGDEEVAKNIAFDFVKSQNEDMNLLLTAFDEKNHSDIQEISHRMKGAARMLACHSFSIPLERLESEATHGNDLVYDELEAELTLKLAQLNAEAEQIV